MDDIFPFILGEREKINGPIGPKADQHAKAAPLSLSRASNPLFDDPAAKVCVDQAPSGAFDGLDEAGIANALLPCKSRKRPGLEDTHPRSSIVL